MFQTRTGAAGLSVLSNTTLIVLKVAAGVMSGSVSIIAEAIHSGIDLLAALIAYITLRFAGKPPDAGHPFGHGKAENVSGTIEAVLIFIAAGIIIYEAIKKLIEGVTLEYVGVGIGVMALSAVVNFVVSRQLLRVAKKEDSIALEADARHLTTDIATSLGVLGGLIVVRITGLHILDPVIALAVALMILRTAYILVRKAFPSLIDVRLPEEEETMIATCISDHLGEVVGFHELRTRKAGRERHIDLHLVVARNASVDQAHRLCDHLEEDIKSQLIHVTVSIHVEPCGVGCGECLIPCPLINKE